MLNLIEIEKNFLCTDGRT